MNWKVRPDAIIITRQNRETIFRKVVACSALAAATAINDTNVPKFITIAHTEKTMNAISDIINSFCFMYCTPPSAIVKQQKERGRKATPLRQSPP